MRVTEHGMRNTVIRCHGTWNEEHGDQFKPWNMGIFKIRKFHENHLEHGNAVELEWRKLNFNFEILWNLEMIFLMFHIWYTRHVCVPYGTLNRLWLPQGTRVCHMAHKIDYDYHKAHACSRFYIWYTIKYVFLDVFFRSKFQVEHQVPQGT